MKTPAEIRALWNRALALHGEARYAEALERLTELESSMPGDPRLLSNLGVICRDSGDLVRAESYLRQACALRPDDTSIHFNLAVTLLRAGRLAEGFREYEWRWQVAQFAGQRREFPQPLWRGEPLEGRRILLYGEQGAGDAIQFARYASLVRNAGGGVILDVLPHLERLFTWLEGGYRVSSELPFELQCPLMSLPHRFGTEIDNIPRPARFLVPESLSSQWAMRLDGGRMNVGLVWAANPAYPGNAARSLPAECLLPIARRPGIQCWSLQVGPASVETPEGVTDLSKDLTDFAETAAVISALDLVVTVDTAVAHLAASFGKPTWLLLAYACDWRWLLEREDTPWYPTMRLFRQKRPGEWGDVIARVASELRP
jgi:hypothetical protein